MPALDPLHPIQSSLVEFLAARPAMTVASLREHLNGTGTPVSLPNLYRLVSQMVDAQILVKEKGVLSLNAVWVSHLEHFTERVKQTHVHSPLDNTRLPQRDGERKEYEADSLAGLDPVWNHVFLKLTETLTANDLYEYASHPYFYLGKTDTEVRLYESIIAEGIACFTLHGNDTFLDRYGEKLVRLGGMRSALTPTPPFPKEGYQLAVYGDYVVECVFAETIANQFAFFFRTVRSMEQFDIELYSQVFRMRAPCELSIRRSSDDAAMLRAKIAPYFAPPPK